MRSIYNLLFSVLLLLPFGNVLNAQSAFQSSTGLEMASDQSSAPLSFASTNPKMDIYPNPSSNGHFHLDLSNINLKSAVSYTVFNLNGDRVTTGTADCDLCGSFDIDIAEDVGTGLYIIQVGNDEFRLLKKILIN